MRYWSAGEQAFEDQDAEEGVFLDYIIIDADWIDYSDCDTENTAAFGIDRGNNNEGTQYDEDLVQKRKDSAFRDDGITVEFYNHEDLGGDPPYLAPEDAIVAEQGENSAGGGCLSMTEEEGWYRMDGFLNGTEADNGEDEEPSEDAAEVEVASQSTWFYICECDSEEEAREELGDPPGETADSDAGGDDAEGEEATPEGEEDDTENETGEEATPDAEATPEEGDGDAEATPEEGDDAEGEEATPEAEETPDEEATPEAEETADETEAEEAEERAEENETGAEEEPPGAENETGAEEEPGADDATPTADDGPGFGAVAALVALLASALLLNRRR